MNCRLFFLIVVALLAPMSSCQAFQCYMTIVKGACWNNYDVSVDVLDSKNDKKILTVVVPKDKLWERAPFSCNVKQILKLQARFSPAVWDADANKIYSAKRFWGLPVTINPGDKAWNVTVCYPNSFAQVPNPLEDNGKNCACDVKSIPPVSAS